MRVQLVALLGAAVLGLTACGSGSQAAEDPDAPLRIGVSPTPHGEILEFVQDNLAEEAGIEFELEQLDDYNRPNEALANGELDANFFQHKPYLEKYQAERGGEFAWVVPVHVEPLGVHSKDVDSVGELPTGAQVTLPNDPANQARALRLLEGEGVLKVDPGTGTEASVRDVVDNPKDLDLRTLAADQLPRSVDDAEAAVVNGNYAVKANLTDPIAAEETEGSRYANGLVSTPQLRDDPRVQRLAELLRSDSVQEFMRETWGDVVVPAS